MNWSAPFVIFRITPSGTLEQVYRAEDLKSAKYWLAYIAQPGDVLCKTPVHPKHSKTSSRAEYWSHKEDNGKPGSREADWKKIASTRNCATDFPDGENAPASTEL